MARTGKNVRPAKVEETGNGVRYTFFVWPDYKENVVNSNAQDNI